jgi:hypothetical protein
MKFLSILTRTCIQNAGLKNTNPMGAPEKILLSQHPAGDNFFLKKLFTKNKPYPKENSPGA